MSHYPLFKRHPRPNRYSGLCWGSLLLGLLLGLSVTATVLILGLKLPDEWLPRAQPPKTAAKEEKPVKPAVKYEFYKILPEIEVVVPDEAAKAAKAAATATAAATAAGKPGSESPPSPQTSAPATAEETGGGLYFIQAGSFKRLEDAERRRAEIALSGEPAQVQSISIDGGTAYRRVRVGPYKTLAAAHAAREKLRAAGIETILVKARE